MKFVYAVLSRLLMVALLVASVLGMLVSFPLQSKWFDPVRNLGHWLIQRLLPEPHMVFWFWFGLFWLVVALGALASALRRHREGVTVQLDDGRVVILESAIRKYLRTALEKVAGFELRKIDIYRLRHRLHVDLYAMVRSQKRLPDLENAAISEVKTALRDQLGIEEEVSVQVYVQDFIGGADSGLVYRRSVAEEELGLDESRPAPAAEPQRPQDAGVAFAWPAEEPELQPVVTASDNAESAEAPSGASKTSGRRGLWGRLWGKSEAAPSSGDATQENRSETDETPKNQ